MGDPPQSFEQGVGAMVGGNGVSLNCDTQPGNFALHLRTRPTSIEFISDPLLFDVLVHLPAQEIYEWVRFVCWKWYRMIHTRYFMYANLHCSTPGFIIQSPNVLSRPMFVSMQRGKMEISNLGYKLSCPIQSAWNGLIVGFKYRDSIFILNPTTKQHYKVPPFDGYLEHQYEMGLAYSASSMEYKVVLAYSNKFHPGYELYVLTIGVDKSWRHIDTQHLSPEANELFGHCPLITEGFVHWAELSYHVVTLNVETEILTETPVPLPLLGEEKRCTFYMSMVELSGDFVLSWEWPLRCLQSSYA